MMPPSVSVERQVVVVHVDATQLAEHVSPRNE
jgi:hypothetical protein